MRELVLLFIIFLSFSCAKSEEDLVDSAKREALYYLTANKCSNAKSALDEVDYQSDDSAYIRLYSDVYACKAGYSQLTTVIDNLGSLTATDADLFKTLASMPASQVETAADSTAYTNIMLAINQLIYSNGTTPSAAARITKFGAREAGDMDYQAMFLILIEMGKYFGFYGNVAADGTKGGGAGAEVCLAELTDATARGHLDNALVGTGDSCTAALNSGASANSSIKSGDSDYVKKLCEGIVLFNNFQDILANISFSSNNSELGDLVNVGAVLNTIETNAAGIEPAVTDYKDITSQTACETLAVTKGNELQRHYALIIEDLHK